MGVRAVKGRQRITVIGGWKKNVNPLVILVIEVELVNGGGV